MKSEMLKRILIEQNETHTDFLNQASDVLLLISRLFVSTLQSGNKILLFGNGGSASDAEHVAGEFVGRFLRERRGVPAIALSGNSAVVTAIANDYGYDQLFSRQLQALGREGDVAVGISTSGNSPNVLNALDEANKLKLRTIGFTGKNGGKLPDHCEICFHAPTGHTPRIQEIHICAWHIICDLVEEALVHEKQ